MKYFIGYPLSGEAKTFHERAAREIAERFSVSSVSDRVPAHVTLKAPFEIDDVSPITHLLDSFSNRSGGAAFRLEDFGHFGRNTVFMSVTPSDGMKNVARSLIDDLGSLGLVSMKRSDTVQHFHSTLATYDIAEKFESIWQYLSGISYNPFQEKLDRLALFAKDKNVWRVCREFMLH